MIKIIIGFENWDSYRGPYIGDLSRHLVHYFDPNMLSAPGMHHHVP